SNGNGNAYGHNKQKQDDGNGPDISIFELNPNPLASTKAAVPAGSTGLRTPVITSHGSTVISTPIIYYIWYGDWNQSNNSDTPTGQAILRDLAIGIGNSPYFKINTSFGQGITGNALLGGEYTDAYSPGSRLRDNSILAIVRNAINHGLPQTANGVYFVLT